MELKCRLSTLAWSDNHSLLVLATHTEVVCRTTPAEKPAVWRLSRNEPRPRGDDLRVCCCAMPHCQQQAKVGHRPLVPGNYFLPLRIAAIRRGLRRPCSTATIHRGFSSGA